MDDPFDLNDAKELPPAMRESVGASPAGDAAKADDRRIVKMLAGAIIGTGLVLLTVVGIAASRDSATSPVPAQATVTQTLPAQTNEPAEESIFDRTDLPVALPFGAGAKQRCVAQCLVVEKDPGVSGACPQMCNRFLVGQVATAVRAVEKTPEAVAQQLAAACDGRPLGSKPQSVEEWDEFLLRTQRLLKEWPLAPETYEARPLGAELAELEQLLMSGGPPEDRAATVRPLAVQLPAVLCQRFGVAATQLAVYQMFRNRDAAAERWFRQLEQSLIAAARTKEAELAQALVPLTASEAP